ncbi:MAG TPA: LiaF domain-containing protein [Gemmatimonadales bacterium]|nr:LiaF domain-containing protein [Gemmatimonadales bacterium]
MRALTVTIALGTLAAAPLMSQDMRHASAARQRSQESDLSVTVTFGVGRLQVRPGPEDVLYRARLQYDAERFEPILRYSPEGRRVRVGIEGLNRGGDLNYRDRPEQRLDLDLSPAVPTDLELTYGAGLADIELGGLSLTRIQVKAGAAESVIRFSRPNQVKCEALTFEVGAINLKAEGLGNARCGRIDLKGAAGDITLDFTGAWPANTTVAVDLKVGLGSVRLRLPANVGVSVDIDRVLASFDRTGLLRRGSRYYSANYDAASTKLDFQVGTAMGHVEVEWVK